MRCVEDVRCAGGMLAAYHADMERLSSRLTCTCQAPRSHAQPANAMRTESHAIRLAACGFSAGLVHAPSIAATSTWCLTLSLLYAACHDTTWLACSGLSSGRVAYQHVTMRFGEDLRGVALIILQHCQAGGRQILHASKGVSFDFGVKMTIMAVALHTIRECDTACMQCRVKQVCLQHWHIKFM